MKNNFHALYSVDFLNGRCDQKYVINTIRITCIDCMHNKHFCVKYRYEDTPVTWCFYLCLHVFNIIFTINCLFYRRAKLYHMFNNVLNILIYKHIYYYVNITLIMMAVFKWMEMLVQHNIFLISFLSTVRFQCIIRYI